MDKKLIHKVQNYILKKIAYISTIPSKEKVVFLTFDDGPEPGITAFVLDELEKYNFKATFFCRGDNANKYPELLARLREQGHSIASHSYSHFHAYSVPAKTYLSDVEKADAVLYTNIFRPPYGSLTIRTWLGLRNKYHIVYWSLNSGDCDGRLFDSHVSICHLKEKTKSGDVILFHFCKKHENETRILLPTYLKWLHENSYQSNAIIM